MSIRSNKNGSRHLGSLFGVAQKDTDAFPGDTATDFYDCDIPPQTDYVFGSDGVWRSKKSNGESIEA